MASAAVLPSEEPSRFAAAFLSAGMHLLLVIVLVVGVSWQSRAPEPVSVELWTQVPEPIETPPVVEPRPEPKPEPKVEPKPAPPPKPAPTPPKPDIVVEKEKKPPLKKEEPKKEEPKKERPLDLDLSRQIREQAQRELENVQRERQRSDALAQFKPTPVPNVPPASAATVRTDARYTDSVRNKIRPLIILPPDIRGNPEAVFDVEQLPTGEVVGVKLRTSSGNAAYDDAIDRAIRKASPLPKPAPPSTPPRMLELHFRPVDR